jgi:hypothetical protein
MISAAPLSYDRAAERVEDMMEQGTSFAHVEDAIDAAHAPQEQKAALWLLAWSLRDPAHQRLDARLMVALVSADDWGGGAEIPAPSAASVWIAPV